MINFLEYNQALNIVWILLGACLIGLIVFLLRKHIPGIKGEDVVEDETKKAEDNVKSKIVEFKPEDENKDDED